MKCPQCGSGTRVAKSRNVDDEARVRRSRVCSRDSSHTFETVEQRTELTLKNVLVRRSGDGQVTERPFDRERLFVDVRTAILKRLDDRTSQALVTDVIRSLEAQLPDVIEPLSADERRARPGFESCIADTVISHAIERRLRATNRLAQVMYAMSIFGREDRRGRTGWANASDVLRWLYKPENYPDLVAAIPVPRAASSANWFPQHPAPEPVQVIKRDTTRLKPFDRTRFVQSIEKALLGRKDAHDRALYVSEWVLWQVAGHHEVLTSQLAVGVMTCLRRVDDIAYLRWAATAKHIDSVTRFRDEALSLLTHPSERLTFLPEAALTGTPNSAPPRWA